jgi:hypothetical protein
VIAGKSLLAFRREAGEEEELQQMLCLCGPTRKTETATMGNAALARAAKESAGGVALRWR